MVRRVIGGSGKGLWVALLLLTSVASAQQQDLEPLLAEGVRLLEKQPDAATALLRQVYEADPGYASMETGSAALAFGQVLRKAGETVQARRIWEAGLRAQVQEQSVSPSAPVDPQLLDAYLEASAELEVGADPVLVSVAFMHMFAGDISRLPVASQRALVRHICLTALLVGPSEPEESAALRGDCQSSGGGLRGRESREGVVDWWRRRDPSPATEANERLVAHLRRVGAARRGMGASGTSTGLDERGDVFVRFGEPTWRRSIDFSQGEFIQTIIRQGLHIRRGEFPSNEIWSYDHIDESGLYVFVQQRDGHYAIGTINDLIPSQLKQRSGGRSPQAAAAQRALLETLRFVLGQLSWRHVGFSARYIQVANELEREEQRQFNRQLQRRGMEGQGITEMQQAAWDALRRNTTDDAYLATQRAVQMPVAYAPPRQSPLPMLARWARFRADDGSTHLHLFWAVHETQVPDACRSASRSAEGGYRARVLAFSPLLATSTLVSDTTYGVGAGRPAVSSHVLPLDGTIETVAVQVDQLPGGDNGGNRADPLCTGVAWAQADSRLPSEGDITISDLLPFKVDDVVGTQARLSGGFSLDVLDPFLSPSIGPEAALGVYFEVYSRTDLSDNYVIEYAVQKRMRGGLLQRGQTRTSLYHARRAAIGRRLQAAFLIDRAEWQGAEEVEVVATVTNLATGQSVERTAQFPVTR